MVRRGSEFDRRSVLQVYFTGSIPLALAPDRRPEYVNFHHYFVPRSGVRRFADRNTWRNVIFSHLMQSPELLMERLWQCVEANHEGRTPPPLNGKLIRAGGL